MLRRLLCGMAVTSGTLIGVAVVVTRKPKPGRSDSSCARAPEVPNTAGRDYFHITRCRGKEPNQEWALQGFGRYQCFLLFDSWREAMDQATFRTESLQPPKSELIEIEC